MSVLAPWLQGTNILAALQAGSNAGLSARAADQRDAEMALRARLAEEENARQEQSAANLLAYHYDALNQARENSTRDDTYREKHDDLLLKQSAAKLLQDKAEGDALEAYRTGELKNSAERNAIAKAREEARLNQDQHVGNAIVRRIGPDQYKELYRSPDKIPTIERVPLDRKKPFGPTINLPANSPLLNQLLESSPSVGTNWPAMKAASPVSTPVAPPVAAPAPVEATSVDEKQAEVEAIRESARQKLLTAPSKRKEILKRLIDAGISVEGL